jgi:hypothetical protein
MTDSDGCGKGVRRAEILRRRLWVAEVTRSAEAVVQWEYLFLDSYGMYSEACH